MKKGGVRRNLWNSLMAYWRWKKSSVTAVGRKFGRVSTDVTVEGVKKENMDRVMSQSPSFSSLMLFPPSSLDTMKRVVHERRSCKCFDPMKSVDLDLIEDILAMTVRAPTGLNLQPWVAVVVHETKQREALSHAALGQPQPLTAPVTVVFAGDMEPEKNAPAVLEMGLDNGYYHPLYGATFLRHVYYLLHGGPLGFMAHTKSFISSMYSVRTGIPLLSVPTNMQAYAWKQVMIPATTFLYLASSAGLDTAVLEGFDEIQVRRVVGLPSHFTVPVIISVGYGAENGFHSVRSPRFPTRHLIRWNKF